MSTFAYAVAFASKLKARASRAKDEDAMASTAPTRPASARSEGELSWTQKRKQAYLRKYGRQRETAVDQADVSVTAVVFVSKLNRLRKAAASP